MTPADYAAAFVAGARWWAERQGQAFDEAAADGEAGARIAGGKMFSIFDDFGTWPRDYAGRVFLKGAKWLEFVAEGATMWPADQDIVSEEAERRYPIEAQP